MIRTLTIIKNSMPGGFCRCMISLHKPIQLWTGRYCGLNPKTQKGLVLHKLFTRLRCRGYVNIKHVSCTSGFKNTTSPNLQPWRLSIFQLIVLAALWYLVNMVCHFNFVRTWLYLIVYSYYAALVFCEACLNRICMPANQIRVISKIRTALQFL